MFMKKKKLSVPKLQTKCKGHLDTMQIFRSKMLENFVSVYRGNRLQSEVEFYEFFCILFYDTYIILIVMWKNVNFFNINTYD